MSVCTHPGGHKETCNACYRNLEAENARLQARVEELEFWWNTTERDRDRYKALAERLQTRAKEDEDLICQIAALVPRDIEREDILAVIERTVHERDGYKMLAELWLSHDISCGYGPSRHRQPDGCDCGLTEARAVVEEKGK